MKNKYGMNIPEDQIDQTIEEAKNKKRIYAFSEEENNYIRYDEKGKSYIASVHGFDRFLYNNLQFQKQGMIQIVMKEQSDISSLLRLIFN